MTTIQLTDVPPFRLWFGDSFRRCYQFGTLLPYQVVGLLGVYPNTFDCRPVSCECVEVFAETNITNDLYNDANSFLFDFPSASGDVYEIDKYVGSSWINVGQFDNTTGTKYPIGYWAEYEFRGGVFIEWQKVLTLYGAGTYRLRLGNILPPPAPNLIMTSPCFILREFDCYRESNTVVVEVIFRKSVTNILWNENAPTPLYFDCIQMTSLQGKGWYDRNRYKGNVGRSQATSKQVSNITYMSGFNNKQFDVMQEAYLMELSQTSEDQKRRILSYGLNCDNVLVSDFKHNNNLRGKTLFEQQYYKRLAVLLKDYVNQPYSYENLIPNLSITLQKRTDIVTRST